MTAEFAPASNLLRESMWLDQDSEVCWIYDDPDTARECEQRGWRRLYVKVPAKETPTAEVASSLAGDAARVMAELRLARVETPNFLVLAVKELRQVDGQRHRLTAYVNAVRDAIRAAEAQAWQERAAGANDRGPDRVDELARVLEAESYDDLTPHPGGRP